MGQPPAKGTLIKNSKTGIRKAEKQHKKGRAIKTTERHKHRQDVERNMEKMKTEGYESDEHEPFIFNRIEMRRKT